MHPLRAETFTEENDFFAEKNKIFAESFLQYPFPKNQGRNASARQPIPLLLQRDYERLIVPKHCKIPLPSPQKGDTTPSLFSYPARYSKNSVHDTHYIKKFLTNFATISRTRRDSPFAIDKKGF